MKTGKEIDIMHFLKDHASQHIPLNYEEAYELGIFVLDCCREALAKKWNELTEEEAEQRNRNLIHCIAVLNKLHDGVTYRWEWNERDAIIHEHRLPQNAAEQVAGICAAIFEHDIAKSRYGFVKPKVLYAIDDCGMGGDLIITANISTIIAFMAAAYGIIMGKHGSPANADKGRHGSSDFIAQVCGINNYASKMEVEQCIEKLGFVYTEACDTRYKLIHIQTHKIAMMPHMNDIIGPITNPINPQIMTKKIMGMNHIVPPRIAAQTYQILNQRGITNLKHGYFVRGFVNNGRYEGIDEVSVCEGGTEVAELQDGEIHEYYLEASDFGLEPIPVEDLKPIETKGEYSMKILRGEITGSRVKIVLANAALLFKLGGVSEDLKECYAAAEEILFSGKAYDKMLAVREMLPIG